MSKKTMLMITVVIWLTVTLACASTPVETPSPTIDTQATVDAAIAGTSTAQVITSEATPEIPATEAPQPIADYSIYAEEELAAEIDNSVDQAASTAEETEAAIDAATEDGTITQEEYETLVVYIDDLAQAIALTEELVSAYYGYYGDLAEDTLYLLQEIEDDLDELYAFTEEMVDLLIEIEAALDAGLEVAEETIDQLVAASENIQTRQAEIVAASQEWNTQLATEIESRATNLLQMAPSEIPANRTDALVAAFAYVDTVREALNDQKINPQELANIAQLGANAVAGLQNHGGPKLQNLSGNINDITGQLARGQIPQAASGLGALEGALGKRP